MLWVILALLLIVFSTISFLIRPLTSEGTYRTFMKSTISVARVLGAVIGSIGGIAIGLRGTTIGGFVIKEGIIGAIVGGFIGIVSGVIGGVLLGLVLFVILKIVLLEPLMMAHIAHDVGFSHITVQESRNSREYDLTTQLLKKKANSNLIAYVSLLIASVWECVLFIQMNDISMLFTIVLTVSLLFLSSVNQRILKRRVDNGLYGTCYSEAKEIVAFILKWHRKNGNSNSKPKPIRLVSKPLKRKISSEISKIQRKIPANV